MGVLGRERSSLRLRLNNKRACSNCCESEVTPASKKQCRQISAELRSSAGHGKRCYLMIKNKTLAVVHTTCLQLQVRINSAENNNMSKMFQMVL